MIEQMIDNPWWWLGLAVLLGIGEILTPGVLLIWVAAAAAIVGAFALTVSIPLALQFLLFAGLCLIAVWAGRRWYRDNPVASQDPLLNDRMARLMGRHVVVVEAIVNGEGRVRVDDGTWTAQGPDAPSGAQMVVVGVSGAILVVEQPGA
jgi:membrane protein implicated in regulation of membrane protease activity